MYRAIILILLFSGIAMAESVEVIDVETGDVCVVSSYQIGPRMVRISYEGKEY